MNPPIPSLPPSVPAVRLRPLASTAAVAITAPRAPAPPDPLRSAAHRLACRCAAALTGDRAVETLRGDATRGGFAQLRRTREAITGLCRPARIEPSRGGGSGHRWEAVWMLRTPARDRAVSLTLDHDGNAWRLTGCHLV
ncbi:hypothetical protein LX16_3612 [Stackebrandtia albiflava]|uniref:Uncharacterized protein n=1 Tax=Stackebrandtia albiflava TaxID=406432 RepID=A0A562V4N2_9ACTN|nr:Rv3235 family protein [Stackebrandtia albiflava]TWJ12846.1 hypothetical protein LX16_3612 [Stackebrandtia albiflava]